MKIVQISSRSIGEQHCSLPNAGGAGAFQYWGPCGGGHHHWRLVWSSEPWAAPAWKAVAVICFSYSLLVG